MGNGNSIPYGRAGVDVAAADALAGRIAERARGTCGDLVLDGVGGFGSACLVPPGYDEPVLVSGTDGVGTKLLLALEWGGEGRIGIDLVAMCVNDVLTRGAVPLQFLDYYACGKLDPGQAERVVGGIARGCEIAGCALVGGETAEMPGMYPPGKIDLAGFAVGICERAELLPRAGIGAGDALIGIESSGAHSNGYSLIRDWIARGLLDPEESVGGERLADALLRPTRIYAGALAAVRGRIKAAAHVTGGGFSANLRRVLPEGVGPRIDEERWPRTPLFERMREAGGISEEEMRSVFNCGIGMALVVGEAEAEGTLAALRGAGEKAHLLGDLR